MGWASFTGKMISAYAVVTVAAVAVAVGGDVVGDQSSDVVHGSGGAGTVAPAVAPRAAVGERRLFAGELGSVRVDVSTTTGEANVHVDDELWLSTGGGGGMHVAGWGPSPLSVTSHRTTTGNDEIFGPFTQTTLVWGDGSGGGGEVVGLGGESATKSETESENHVVETSFIAYERMEIVQFKQSWPRGWEGDNYDDELEGVSMGNRTILAAFPAIGLGGPVAATTAAADLNFITWGDCFAVDLGCGRWNDLANQNVSSLFDGVSRGEPLVLHMMDEGRVLNEGGGTGVRTAVVSPLDNFFVSGQAASEDGSSIKCGIRTTVRSLPPGFAHSTLMVFGRGINSTMVDWGDALLHNGGRRVGGSGSSNDGNSSGDDVKQKIKAAKTRVDPYDDYALAHLGYWTDNGAFYYRAHPNFTNAEEALLAVKEDFADRHIPVRYYQWDDWWMEKVDVRDRPGMTSWTPKPDVFPSGFTDWLGAPLSLYAPMYAAKNDWVDVGYNFKSEPDGHNSSVPLDIKFYRDLFRNGTEIGMKMFEQDFLCESGYGGTGLTKTDVTTGRLWMDQMDDAAMQANVTLQFCMMNPYHALHSTLVRRMTNGRATGDNTRSYDSIKSMGPNGLLFYALGFLPSRDNVWTTEANAHADNAVAVLSGGPYGIADAVGRADRNLVMRSCRTDGVLLKPSWPMSSLDFTFSNRSVDGAMVWAAHDDYFFRTSSSSSHFRWSYVIGVDLERTVAITPSRLQGPSHRPSTMVAWEVKLDDGEGAQGVPTGVIRFSDEHPPMLPSSSPPPSTPPGGVAGGAKSSIAHWVAVPVLPNGSALLGEMSKWATMSRRRVSDLEVTTTSTTATVLGAPEEVAVFAYIPSGGPGVSEELGRDDPGMDAVALVECDFGLSTDCMERDVHGNTDCRLLLSCTAHRCQCGTSSVNLLSRER